MTKARNIADIGSNDVLDTDAVGLTVSGDLTVADSYPDFKIQDTDGSDQFILMQQVGGASMVKFQSGTNDGELYFTGGRTGVNKMKIATNGDITMYKDDGTTAGMTFDASSGNSSFKGATTTIGSSAASTNVELNLDGVANKAQRIQFREGVTNRWLLGQGAASETSAFELYNATGTIALKFDRGTNVATFASGAVFNENGLNQDFRVESDNNTHAFFVDASSGNLGVDTIPESTIKFDVNSGSTTSPMRLRFVDDNNGSSNNPFSFEYKAGLEIENGYSGAAPSANGTKVAKLQFTTVTSNGYGATASLMGLAEGTGYDAGALVFTTGSNSSGLETERLRISANGNIGVGTDSPAYKLETKNGDISTIKLTSAAGGNAVNGVRFRVHNSADTTQSATLGMVNAETVSGWGGVLTFSTKPTNSTPNEAVTERMRVDHAGRVTTPYQPTFKVGRTGNYTPGAGNAILFNDTSGNYTNHHWNVGNHYSASTGRFTAPVTGTYLVQSLIIFGPSVPAGQRFDDVYDLVLNSSRVTYSFKRAEYVDGYTGNGGYYTDHASALVKMSAQEYIWCRMNYASIGIHGNTAYSWFSAYLLG